MDINPCYNQELPLAEAMKLAGTPKGQQLLKQLQEQHKPILESAMAQAQAGDYHQVKQLLTALLQSPEGKSLLEQLRG